MLTLEPTGATDLTDRGCTSQGGRLANDIGAGGALAGGGFDSESLRQLAKLRSWETGAALVLTPEALRSIGFDPAPAEEEFTARCQAALDIVQRDLDVTGYGQYQVRAYLTQRPTAAFAALPDGSAWTGACGMTREIGRCQPALRRGRIGLRHDQRGG